MHANTPAARRDAIRQATLALVNQALSHISGLLITTSRADPANPQRSVSIFFDRTEPQQRYSEPAQLAELIIRISAPADPAHSDSELDELASHIEAALSAQPDLGIGIGATVTAGTSGELSEDSSYNRLLLRYTLNYND